MKKIFILTVLLELTTFKNLADLPQGLHLIEWMTNHQASYRAAHTPPQLLASCEQLLFQAPPGRRRMASRFTSCKCAPHPLKGSFFPQKSSKPRPIRTFGNRNPTPVSMHAQILRCCSSPPPPRPKPGRPSRPKTKPPPATKTPPPSSATTSTPSAGGARGPSKPSTSSRSSGASCPRRPSR